jgi:hypothetical protein
LDLLEVRQGGGVKVFLEGDLLLLCCCRWVLTKNVGFALAFTVVGHIGPVSDAENPSFRSVTESSRAETVALLLGEDLCGKQDQADRCA